MDNKDKYNHILNNLDIQEEEKKVLIAKINID